MASGNVLEFDKAQRAKEIARLASLSRLDYEVERLAAAERLKCRAPELDREVKAARPKEEKAEPALQLSLDLLVTKFRALAADRNMAFGYGGGSWYVYSEGHWTAADTRQEEDMARILAQLAPEVGLVYSKDTATIDKHLRTSMHFRLETSDFDKQPFVAVRNGTVNIMTGEKVPHNKDHKTTRYVDIDFDPDATCPEWEAMINNVLADSDGTPRPQVAGFIQEWMGVAVAGGSGARTPRAMRKALFLFGPPNSGKSTIFDVTRELLGTDRVVSSRVDEVNDRFGLEAFLSAAAWITEEVDDVNRSLGTSRVKCLITGEPVAAQRKMKPNATLQFTGPVGWAGNSAPKFSEASDAVYDRIVMVPMEQTFTPEDAKAKFGNMKPLEWLYAQGEFAGIFNWALAGYRRLLARGHFENISYLKSAKEGWREQNDVVFDFIRNHCEPMEGVWNEPETLAWAALGFAKATRTDRWPSIASLKTAINSVMRELHPKIGRTRPRVPDATAPTGERRPHAYAGFALKPSGLAYFNQAKQDQPHATENLRANERSVL